MRGATDIKRWGVLQLTVSIHAPHAGRDFGCQSAHKVFKEFQSTRPMRGATDVGKHLLIFPVVSIHAPHAGRD